MTSADSLSEPTAIAIAVVESEGRILIGQRPADAPLGGLWEFPGGKIEEGESAADAAIRECVEETGVLIDVGRLYLECVHQYDHGCVRLHFFACTPRTLMTTPLRPYRWVARGELGQYEFPDANKPVLETLLREV